MSSSGKTNPGTTQPYQHRYVSALGHHSDHFVQDKHWMPVVLIISIAILIVAVAILISGRKLTPGQFLQSLSGPVVQVNEEGYTHGGNQRVFERNLKSKLQPAADQHNQTLIIHSSLRPLANQQ